MFGWIVSIVLGVALYGVWRASRALVDRSLRGRDPRLTDRLSEYGGAHGADLALGGEAEEGVARLYERMCVLEPVKWAGDPRIPGVVERYSDIISGREADPAGLNVPSPEILGGPNPDYEKYLRSQRRLSKSEGALRALRGARHARKEQEIRDGFRDGLLTMGMPEGLVDAAVTDDRVESYEQEDWRGVVKAASAISAEHGESVALDMLMLFEDARVLCEEGAADTFVALRNQGVPAQVVKDVLEHELTIEQAERAAALVEMHTFEWGEAVKEVVCQDAKDAAEEGLREQYRKRVHRRRRKAKA